MEMKKEHLNIKSWGVSIHTVKIWDHIQMIPNFNSMYIAFPVQSGKIIISINIKNISKIILAIKLLTFYNIKKILQVIY